MGEGTVQLLTILSAIIGTSGFGAIAVAFVNKGKNKADASEVNVKTAIELNKMMMEQHKDINQDLAQAKASIAEAEKKLKNHENYIVVLEDILTKNGIDFPRRKE